jgi:hypothetical protein
MLSASGYVAGVTIVVFRAGSREAPLDSGHTGLDRSSASRPGSDVRCINPTLVLCLSLARRAHGRQRITRRNAVLLSIENLTDPRISKRARTRFILEGSCEIQTVHPG